MKMYILIRESVPTGFAMLAAAYASLAFRPRAEWPKAFKFYRLYK